jgi:DNA (cytosine-5)-methyltransferase 1
MKPITFGSLFAGIGGFDLGFERAGMECRWQVEIETHRKRVLAKHWPKVRRWGDVRTWPQPDTERVDVICGGFPCQDISAANPKGKGLGGSRSGLWWEFHRIIEAMQPAWVVIENSPVLRSRGLEQVLRALAAIGFDAEWHCVPAAAFGACHRRDRIWIIANANGLGSDARAQPTKRQTRTDADQRRSQNVGDVDRKGLAIRQGEPGYPRPKLSAPERTSWWDVEPNVVRVVHGLPERVDRVASLGNAVVPQAAEWIGRRIVEAINSQKQP